MFWLWGWLVFWFGLFFGLRWDGGSGFFVGWLCWMGGMGIVYRKIVSTTIKIDQQGAASYISVPGELFRN